MALWKSVAWLVLPGLALVSAVPASVAAQVEPGDRARTRQLLEQHREAAIEQVLRAARSEAPALRANAIEAMQPVPEQARPLVQRGLEDENPGVQFGALVSVGQLRLDELSEAALALRRHRVASVRAAALYAARACGREVDMSPLAAMLASQEPTVRGNVAMLLGMLDDASAIPMLEEMAHVPMPRVSAVRHAIVRIQIAEALVRLGQDGALDALRAGVFSHHDEVRVLSVQALGKLDDAGMEAALEQIVEGNEPIELRLAAAEALARTSGTRAAANDAALAVMREGAGWDNPAVRAQAAFTLGQYSQPAAAERLIALLREDPSEQVRLSAAAAVLRALGP